MARKISRTASRNRVERPIPQKAQASAPARPREEVQLENFFLGAGALRSGGAGLPPGFHAGFIWDDDQLLTANPAGA